jgi:hypothetical protein
MFNAPNGANMETATHHSEVVNAGRLAAQERKAAAFIALDRETRAAVETACAAYHLNRQPQTLRAWACLENGPLRPVRVHGRLAWKVADLRRVLGVA